MELNNVSFQHCLVVNPIEHTMNCLIELNECSQGIQKLTILETHKQYKVEKFSSIKTKYGEALIVQLSDVGEVFLPKRFSDMIMKINELNLEAQSKNMYLTKTGETVGKYTPIEFSE